MFSAINQVEKSKRVTAVESAVRELRDGRLILLINDIKATSTAVLICGAEKVTPEVVNFMSLYGRGVLTLPLTPERCDELNLPLMATVYSSVERTPFTVSIDLLVGTTTGISASDRAMTILAVADPDTRPRDLGRPGHVFPIRTSPEGIWGRIGVEEAALDLMRLAGMRIAAALVCQVLNDDGNVASPEQVTTLANSHRLSIVSLSELVRFRILQERITFALKEFDLDTEMGKGFGTSYGMRGSDSTLLAVRVGELDLRRSHLVAMTSMCAVAPIVGKACQPCALETAFVPAVREAISQAGSGLLIHLMRRSCSLNPSVAMLSDNNGPPEVFKCADDLFALPSLRARTVAELLGDHGVKRMRLMHTDANLVAQFHELGFEAEFFEPPSINARFGVTAQASDRKQSTI